MAKVNATLIRIIVSTCPVKLPVARYCSTSIAPMIPKIAPDAPTVTLFGLAISAPDEPARPDTR